MREEHVGQGDTISMASGQAEGNNIGPLFSCPDCVYKTTSLRKLGRHRSVNHAGVKYRCEHCDFVTGYQSNYYRHRKQVHNGGMSQSALQAATTSTSNRTPQPNRRQPAANFGNGVLPAAMPTPFMNDDQQRVMAALMASSAMPVRCDQNPFQSNIEQLASALFPTNACPLDCAQCGVTMATKSQWQEHMRAYHSRRTDVFSKADYTNLLRPLMNNSAAAITAAHLLMAAATGAGGGYDLNVLASAATLASNGPAQQRAGKSNGNDAETDCKRYYACVYDCDFASFSSRQYLHHLREAHGERFAIFYCDRCDDYATKFAARLRRHKAIAHDEEDREWNGKEKDEQNGEETNGVNGNVECGREAEEDVEERKLSIVLDPQNTSASSIEPPDDAEDDDAEDTAFQCLHCSYTTNQLASFQKHSKCHDSTTEGQRCQFCDFRTIYGWNLECHVRCHQGNGKFTCRRCSFSQNTKQSMQFHLRNHHNDVEFVTAGTQTEENGNWIDAVDVGFETFLFEKHAVRVNEDGGVEEERAIMEEKEIMDDGYDEPTPLDSSPIDLANRSDSARNSTPTPPALLLDGASAIIHQNRRHQLLHSRVHSYRRRHQMLQAQRPHSASGGRAMRKFLSEQEAIEIPSDALTNEFDNDPDIKNRHCSVCGYQGKWISEMIRHKRVHTNERPFKCKYCSRTSKWKADLIRHVAKVHGYRVVSKYSRSKTFDDAEQTAMKALKGASQCSSPPASTVQTKAWSTISHTASGKETESPNLDNAEFEDVSVEDSEGLDLSMDERKISLASWTSEKSQRKCPGVETNEQKYHEMRMSHEMGIQKSKDAANDVDEEGKSSAAYDNSRAPVSLNESTISNGSCSPRSAGDASPPTSKQVRDLVGSKQLTGLVEKYVMIKQTNGGEAVLKCRACPYETRDLHTFRAHTQKHENKKPYLCSTCGYRSNWSSDVHKHIRLKKSGHETAYVIKLNEGDSPGQNGDTTPANTFGHVSTCSDASSNEGVNNETAGSSGEIHNGGGNLNADAADSGRILWRCTKCDFEDSPRSVVIEHLQKVHRVPPFACRHCDFTSMHRKICLYHAQCQHDCRDSSIIENITCEYRAKPAPKQTMDMEISRPREVINDEKSTTDQSNAINMDIDDHGDHPNNDRYDQRLIAANAANVLAASALKNGDPTKMDWLQLAQLCFLSGFPLNTGNRFTSQSIPNGEGTSGQGEKRYPCDKCPFVGRAEADWTMHEKGHRGPNKGLMCYKCVFCDWYAPKKTAVLEHMKLHTDDPDIYKAEVERNMITPLSRKRALEDSDESAAANALLGLAKAEKMYKRGDQKSIIDECGDQKSDSLQYGQRSVNCKYDDQESIDYKYDQISVTRPYSDQILDIHHYNHPKCSTINAAFGQEKMERGEKITCSKSIKLNVTPATGQNGGGVVLGRSDVDDVMSDFNAIINAADQDLAQENGQNGSAPRYRSRSAEEQCVEKEGKSAGQSVIDSLLSKVAGFSNVDLDSVALGNVWPPDSKGQSIGDGVGQSDEKGFDREAYIHAGEDAFDPILRLNEVAQGEIQKVTAVVDGQVRKMWQCRHCPHISKRRANVRMHEKKHFKSSAIGVFKCPKCNYRGDKRSLHVHYRVHMAAENGGSGGMPELFQCISCPAIFQCQDDLTLHSVNHNSSSTNDYRCALCSYAVSSSSALQKHTRVHDRQSISGIGVSTNADERSTKRQTANRRYTNSAAIANVVVQHEEISNVLNPGVTGAETALNLVTRRSTGMESPLVHSSPSPTSVNHGANSSAVQPLMKPKKYLCTKCPAKFTDRTQLNRHIHFHGVKLKFKCCICDYSVPFPINLTKHMKSHHNIDVADAVSLSDNENESDATGCTEPQPEGDASPEGEGNPEEQPASLDQDGFNCGSVVNSPSDGPLKIKINLGALKPVEAVNAK